MNKTELLNKLSRDSEERLLLARTLDRLELARTRNIQACTGFLSPQERASVENLLSASGHPAHLFYGGYEGAERTVCAFLPDWLEGADWASDPDSCPVRAIRCTWNGGSLSHRDFLRWRRSPASCFSTWSRRAAQNSRPPPCPWTGWSPRR